MTGTEFVAITPGDFWGLIWPLYIIVGGVIVGWIGKLITRI